MLYEDGQIPELHYMKHRHDDDADYVNYQDSLLDKSLSPYLYNNNIMNSFLKKLQRLISIIFDQHNIVKNFKNFMVHKYYYKHSR